MNRESNSARALRVLARFSEAPLELRCYAVFALVATVLKLSLVYWAFKHDRDLPIPIMGSSPDVGYMFSVQFAFFLIFMRVPPVDARPLVRPEGWNPWMWKLAQWNWRRRTTRPYNAMRLSVIFSLLIQILYGFLQVLMNHGNRYSSAPTSISDWQLLWTAGLPALWILILFSPRMNHFCGRAAEVSGGVAAVV